MNSRMENIIRLSEIYNFLCTDEFLNFELLKII